MLDRWRSVGSFPEDLEGMTAGQRGYVAPKYQSTQDWVLVLIKRCDSTFYAFTYTMLWHFVGPGCLMKRKNRSIADETGHSTGGRRGLAKVAELI